MLASTSTTFELPDAVETDGQVYSIPVGRIPTTLWPDGRWCLEANMFLVDLARGGRSTFGRGGTIATYASQLKHLVRFCAARELDFVNISDGDFGEFVRFLTNEPNVDYGQGKARTDNVTLQIGRLCLNFMEFLGEFIGNSGLVGPTGQIRARKERVIDFRGGRGRGNTTQVWTHHSFPAKSTFNKRSPIDRDSIERLREAAAENSSSTFLLKRRLIMILLLEMTGCRRAELVSITIKSVKAALQMKVPSLRVLSVKRGGNRTGERLIRMRREVIEFVDEYIRINRRPLIRATCGSNDDDGFLFVNARTGKQLTAEYIGCELYKLRRLAGLEGRAHAHMFRHRFITMQFVRMIEQHNFENEDEFRKALINTAALKQKMIQWTGHRSQESLDHYIDLAFGEVAGFQEKLEKMFGTPCRNLT